MAMPAAGLTCGQTGAAIEWDVLRVIVLLRLQEPAQYTTIPRGSSTPAAPYPTTMTFIIAIWMLILPSTIGASDLVAGGSVVLFDERSDPRPRAYLGPSQGFGYVLGGSSLGSLNGVYCPAGAEYLQSKLVASNVFQKTFVNRVSGWLLAFGDEGWLIVDERGRNRFGTRNRGELPMPGDWEGNWGWRHLDHAHRSSTTGVTVGADGSPLDDDGVPWDDARAAEWHAARRAELPWEIVQVTSVGRLEAMARHAEDRHRSAEADRRKGTCRKPRNTTPAATSQETKAAHIKAMLLTRGMGQGAGDHGATLQSSQAATVAASVVEEEEEQAEDASLLARSLGPPVGLVTEPFETLAGTLGPEATAHAAMGGAAEAREEWSAAAGYYAAALSTALPGSLSEDEGTDEHEARAWTHALLQLRRAACTRRARGDPIGAAQAVASCLALRPRYARCLHEAALQALDRGDYAASIVAWEEVWRFDPRFPGLATWLLRALAHDRRRAETERLRAAKAAEEHAARKAVEAAAQRKRKGFRFTLDGGGDDVRGQVWPTALPPPVGPKQQPGATRGGSRGFASLLALGVDEPNHYLVLGLAHDADAAEVRKSFRALSLKLHPDKHGGITSPAYARALAAHHCLSDTAMRSAFDFGDGLLASFADPQTAAALDRRDAVPDLRDEVFERYWPDKVPFWPYGDPLALAPPELAARRDRLQAEAVAAEEAAWHRDFPDPDLSRL